MIDLGAELVHYGDERAQQQHGFTLSDLHNMRARSYWAPATKRLADLQAQGFMVNQREFDRAMDRNRMRKFLNEFVDSRDVAGGGDPPS
jgi:hypothetical protein